MKRREGGQRPRVPPLPPGLVLHGGDGAWDAVLRELPDPAALPAWETLRCLRLWIATEPQRRAGLFREGAQARRELELVHQAFDLELTGPLSVLAELMADGSTEPGEMVWACLCVAEWANLRGARETAGLFAETAALAAPEKPGLAFVAGRMARSRGDGFTAERWLRRAASVAWRVEEWEVYARSVNSLGNLRTEQGRLSEARHILAKALRASRRHGLQTLEGEILHDLAVVAIASGHGKQADQLVNDAFQVYRSGHPRLPALAYDVAYHWMSEGYFARALTVFQALLTHFEDHPRRLQVLAAMARGSGASGQHSSFQKFWTEVFQLSHSPECQRVLAAVLLDVGRGASSLAEWDHAEEALSSALRIATERGEADVIAQAKSALESIRLKGKADPAPERISARAESQADLLAKAIVLLLKEATGETA
jgi:tetratricopeptide (TPR) repeat protein